MKKITTAITTTIIVAVGLGIAIIAVGSEPASSRVSALADEPTPVQVCAVQFVEHDEYVVSPTTVVNAPGRVYEVTRPVNELVSVVMRPVVDHHVSFVDGVVVGPDVPVDDTNVTVEELVTSPVVLV